MVRIMIAALGVLLVGWGAVPATAQTELLCGERAKVVAGLEKGYEETPTSMGLASNGAVVEVLASPKGTFTIILTQPNGLSCLMAAGDNWEDLPHKIVNQRNGV